MRPLGVISAWLVATLVSMLLVWNAVRPLLAEGTDQPSLTLSQDRVAEIVATSDLTTTTSTTTTETVPVPVTEPTATTPPVSTSLPAGGDAAPPPPATQQQVFHLQGGSVAIEYGAGVELLWASPAAGFRAEIKKQGPPDVEVEFESEEHESRFRAEVVNGELEIDEEERPDSSG
jgi:hypothetical protein